MNRLIFILALAGAGCASGGDVWREVATPHFIVRTDLDVDAARRAAAALESDRDMLVSAAWPKADLPEWARPEVYVLASRAAFAARFGSNTVAVARGFYPFQIFLFGAPESWEGRGNLALPAVSRLRQMLAYKMANQAYETAPVWFLEGLAEFLETVHLSENGRSVVVGAIHPTALAAYRDHRAVRLARLIKGETWPLDDNWPWKGTSWVFVHWLINTQSERFSRFRTDLGQGIDGEVAFKTSFPGFDTDEAEREIGAYSQHGDYGEIEAPLVSTKLSYQERVMSPADLLVVDAQLRRGASNSAKPSDAIKAQMRNDVERALALDPTNVGALWLDDWTPKPQMVVRLRAAAAAHPDDGRARQMLGDFLRETGGDLAEREQAQRKAAALEPHNPDLLIRLAQVLVELKRPAEAVPFAVRALKRAPTYAYVREIYAAAMFDSGHCSNAVSAMEWIVRRTSAEALVTRPENEKKLAGYRAKCPTAGTR
jgi:hypothetical protein